MVDLPRIQPRTPRKLNRLLGDAESIITRTKSERLQLLHHRHANLVLDEPGSPRGTQSSGGDTSWVDAVASTPLLYHHLVPPDVGGFLATPPTSPRRLPAGRPLGLLAELNGVASKVGKAAVQFDERHQSRCARAQRAIGALSRDGGGSVEGWDRRPHAQMARPSLLREASFVARPEAHTLPTFLCFHCSAH